MTWPTAVLLLNCVWRCRETCCLLSCWRQTSPDSFRISRRARIIRTAVRHGAEFQGLFFFDALVSFNLQFPKFYCTVLNVLMLAIQPRHFNSAFSIHQWMPYEHSHRTNQTTFNYNNNDNNKDDLPNTNAIHILPHEAEIKTLQKKQQQKIRTYAHGSVNNSPCRPTLMSELISNQCLCSIGHHGANGTSRW